MGKYVRILIAIGLVSGIVLLARHNLVWAGPAAQAKDSVLAQDQPSVVSAANAAPGTVKPPPPGIVIPVTGGGTYAVGGICTMTIEYKAPGLSDVVSLEVPVEKSRSVPFPESLGKIHLPGCQVVHYQFEQVKSELSLEDGSWTICFAAQPNKTTTIYYYLDDLETVIPTWVALETTVENGRACAPANYSGVYAPASK